MGYDFYLSGRTWELTAEFFPPIQLSPERRYEIALVNVEVANTMPNVFPGRDRFYYRDATAKNDDAYSHIVLPEGSYEIDSLSALIAERVPNVVIKGNPNTLSVEFISSVDIDFRPDDCIGPLLGFSKRTFRAKDRIVSDRAVDVMAVTAIRVACDLVENSYVNGQKSRILHEIVVDVDPGFKLFSAPSQLIYLPINRTTIDSITLQFLDTENNPINFRGEATSARLHLREAD